MTEGVKNYMEEVVDRVIENVLKDMDICKCDICKTDIKALALNELIPKYVVTQKGELYVKLSYLDPQFETDAASSIVKSAEIVNNKKRHN